MRLPLRDMLRGTNRVVRLQGTLDMSEAVRQDPSLVQATPAKVEAEAFTASDAVEVHGTIHSDLTWVCSRCLREFSGALDTEFRETFADSSERGEPLANEQEDDDVQRIADDYVDLTPYVYEHIVLSLPQFPLCTEHCRGLCPRCGIDRNQATCSCDNEPTDPRWQQLQQLLH